MARRTTYTGPVNAWVIAKRDERSGKLRNQYLDDPDATAFVSEVQAWRALRAGIGTKRTKEQLLAKGWLAVEVKLQPAPRHERRSRHFMYGADYGYLTVYVTEITSVGEKIEVLPLGRYDALVYRTEKDAKQALHLGLSEYDPELDHRIRVRMVPVR
ncbi:MAG: hypothetical protein A3B23_01395 [Candidatus Colwellbacteria bacterium RIFCSPLOWO2_01_FULL_48_10]|uniref:Uncharacterized protein n=2 Tax=Bacteria candidate phyla TaxID=1783234 RepID=A0A1F5P454_9BACT|nr:MAG: hypothetical protein A2846_04165 [Candidatus Doudnabacteria bacterium RIFCSPHIGHO2_01_FULL_49_9]OGY59737.1 MAG: hypothetical protein A3B23_01395 [Candidatus Colwellbacteria bacterium RIFCSPLOWO2_01_FULL_48_10]